MMHFKACERHNVSPRQPGPIVRHWNIISTGLHQRAMKKLFKILALINKFKPRNRSKDVKIEVLANH